MAIAIVRTMFKGGDVLPNENIDVAPAAGNLLMAMFTKRDGSLSLLSGWNELFKFGAGGGSDDMGIWWKTAVGNEAAFSWSGGQFPSDVGYYELSGCDSTSIVHNHSDYGSSGSLQTSGLVTPPAGRPAIIIGGLCSVQAGIQSWTPSAGWTEDWDKEPSLGPQNHPLTTFLHKIVAAASGSYNPEATYTTASNPWRGVTFAVSAPASGSVQGLIV